MPSVKVTPADVGDEPVLRRLLELYRHDFSEFDDGDVDDGGTFGYPYLHLYWLESDRHPFIIRVDGRLAGFALVRGNETRKIAEFFVMRKYRRRGVGREVASDVFARFPGPWRVHQVPGNDAAVAFWRQAITVPFTEVSDADGTYQSFVQPGV